MKFRVLDIETIPDESVWTKGEPKCRLVSSREAQLVRDHRTGAECEEFPARVELEDPFPPPQAHRVVALAYVDVVLDAAEVAPLRVRGVKTMLPVGLQEGPVEGAGVRVVAAARLLRLGRVLSGRGDLRDVERPGVRPAGDLHALAQAGRALRVVLRRPRRALPVLAGGSPRPHGLPLGLRRRAKHEAGRRGQAGGPAGQDRHDGRLGALRVPGDDGAGRGPGVLRGRRNEVGRYCLQDAVQTALVFLRTRFHLGKIDRDEYHACLATFEQHPDVRAAIDIDWDAVRLP